MTGQSELLFVMQISAVDKPPEVLTLEEDIKSESSETNTVATIENNVIVLEESEVASPALDLTFRIPEAAGKCYLGNFTYDALFFHIAFQLYKTTFCISSYIIIS